jgi:hypothetical protein
MQPSKKLSEKNLGPFEVIAQDSHTLRLPDSMCTVHPVFHVSQIEPATPNTIPNRVQPLPPPIVIDGEPDFKIAEILNANDNRRHLCKLLYLVRWAGYEGTDEETSWILISELSHASELVADFHSTYPNKPGPLSKSYSGLQNLGRGTETGENSHKTLAASTTHSARWIRINLIPSYSCERSLAP